MKNKNETKQKHMAERTVFDLIRRAIKYLLTTKQTHKNSHNGKN